MNEPILCPITPELVELLRRPGGIVTKGPARIWLATDNTLVVQELTEAEQLNEMLWGDDSGKCRPGYDHEAGKDGRCLWCNALIDGCDCPCHTVVQAGLVPCPRCGHDVP